MSWRGATLSECLSRQFSGNRPLHCLLFRRSRLRQRSTSGNTLHSLYLLKFRGNVSCVSCGAAVGTYPLFAASLIYVLPFYTMMIFYPHHPRTRKILSSSAILLPLATAYGYLLVASWQPDTLQLMMPGNMHEGFKGFNPQYFPKLKAIQILFSRLTTAASLWLHIVAVNFFFARNLFLDGHSVKSPASMIRPSIHICSLGLVKRIPTRHSCFLAMFLGPMAIISATVTEMFWRPHENTRNDPSP